MSMQIQRVPRGLANLISSFGGLTPRELEDQVRACIDATQFYGLQTYIRQLGTDPALALGGTINLTVPATEFWLLYDVGCNIVGAAGMTSAHISFAVGPTGSETAFFSFVPPPAIAATFQDGLTLPYPRLLLPGWRLQLRLNNLQGVANASVAFSAGVGVLG